MIVPTARIASAKGTIGSGFVLAANSNGTYVLTNHHVIQDSIQCIDIWDPVEKSSKKRERLQAVQVQTFRYDDRGRHSQTVTTPADIVAYTQYGDEWDFEGDLAVLKLRAPIDGVQVAFLMSEEDFWDDVRLLDDVVMVGCPESSALPLPTSGHVASLTEERGGVGLMLSQVFGNPGSSGSAVYRFSAERERFEVIAVHSMVDSRGSLADSGKSGFLRLAVPVPRLHAFLKDHGLTELMGATGQEDEPNAEEELREEEEAEGEAEEDSDDDQTEVEEEPIGTNETKDDDAAGSNNATNTSGTGSAANDTNGTDDEDGDTNNRAS